MEDNPDYPKEESHMQFRQKEQAILSQIVKLLVNEKLVSPEEHLRFLALLKEEA
ncbi:MAG: hypothetical protein HFG72_08420 [Hungatella sp.]|jgi:hypothetical protein|nr:hypothetical protein [Hungatella sp.]